MAPYQTLKAWQHAERLAIECVQVSKKFPDYEQARLADQLRRASYSVVLNIAEGSSRHSRDDYTRFLEIATGSVFEVVSQSFIGRNQGFLNEEQFRALYAAAEEQSRMLSGLRRSLCLP